MAMKYKIEKNVSMKKEKGGLEFPFNRMEIGDSFTFPATQLHAARSSAWRCRNRSKEGWNFAFRSQPPNRTVFRVWRIANDR
jgi:hypothetical protein